MSSTANPLDRAATNRLNAAKSTGPRTAEGKQRSSLNAFRHGLTAQTVVLPSEDRAAYLNLVQEFMNEYAPAGPSEQQLVQTLADSCWRLKRCDAIEEDPSTDMEDPEVQQSIVNQDKQLQRIARQFERGVKYLRAIQAERKTRQQHEMHEAAILYKLHLCAAEREASQDPAPSAPPELYDPAADGFVFTLSEIEAHITRKLRMQSAIYLESLSSAAGRGLNITVAN